ncbi:ABC transporter permease [Trueperella pyogenes]|uniref:ABC transporter permease n=1 Tax=Trueperella pyogenes TaxID=1661 RepID=UPI00345D75BB
MFIIDVKRTFRDPGVIFVIGIPVLMYLIFGAAQSYGQQPIGNGNVAMAIMVGMAAYGATSATVSLASSAGVERLQGWGRQLALTPLTAGRFALNKSLAATAFAVITAAIIYAVAAPTGASGTWLAWTASFLIIVLGALPFALYGLALSYLFRSEVATSVATGLLILFGFAGNLFVPLSGTLLEISRFTPMWGYITLARWPVTEGAWTTSTGGLYSDKLWQAALSLGIWTLIFALLAAVALRRRGART